MGVLGVSTPPPLIPSYGALWGPYGDIWGLRAPPALGSQWGRFGVPHPFSMGRCPNFRVPPPHESLFSPISPPPISFMAFPLFNFTPHPKLLWDFDPQPKLIWGPPPEFRSPTGEKFRSKIELSRFLGPDRDLANFDFKNGLERPGGGKVRGGQPQNAPWNWGSGACGRFWGPGVRFGALEGLWGPGGSWGQVWVSGLVLRLGFGVLKGLWCPGARFGALEGFWGQVWGPGGDFGVLNGLWGPGARFGVLKGLWGRGGS